MATHSSVLAWRIPAQKRNEMAKNEEVNGRARARERTLFQHLDPFLPEAYQHQTFHFCKQLNNPLFLKL